MDRGCRFAVRWGGARAVRAGLLWLVVAAAPVVAAPPPLAPIALSNEMPMSAAFLQLPPADARGLAASAWSATLTLHAANMIMAEEQDGVAMRMDLESETARLALAYGAAERATVRATLGYRWHTGGVLDGFIASAEDHLGLPTPWSRRHTDRGETDWSIREGETTTFAAADPASGATDLAADLAWRLTDARGFRPATAVRVGVKLPTAPVRDGLGSGGVDWAIGGLATFPATRWATHLAAAMVWPSRHHGLAGTAFASTSPFASASATEVAALGRQWEASCSLAWRESPYSQQIDSILEASSMEVAFGLRRRAAGSSLFFALTENLLDKGAPDLGLLFGVEVGRW
ncbi:MAG: hypothetical protein COW73_11610 [Nitrospirae bacterium CG18_big_fil_WC_8_21_14_2_50_70_55]|nr:DUF3187 family protein [Deltaproteobacteria bacterium]OIP66106.1 MAG: hypothetical protein AUK30_03095 [Nitrospirae bacterium CG2_30_70_394]PIQ03261.1 MAG: hypothetical protein COW73_11610 [Nitrospirae bacterium CG18_big_fil_WC_8_21_14_2_50_70_55]PIU77501.1 MAG: hypothetical protein COS73_10325 [Nitrospirae bacterium CG06_land_8_20_14_3_00_70_43]PIW83055.1 MAG: hypothetical protein COZ96_05335 [Nitrospirae bacterium CG_4_8_14_3_um_filter_70_85]PIX82723.1 MAG: hypothetical protein COZ33_0914